MVYVYQGFFVFRSYCFFENYIPQSIKPFPYVNLWSSSNVVLWINIGRELEFDSNSLLVTAFVA